MSPNTCEQHDASIDLRDLAPSEKLVLKTLQYTGELTQKDLAEETRLNPRTVRYALRTLEEHGVVTSRIHFQDARQHIYSLTLRYQVEETDHSKQ